MKVKISLLMTLTIFSSLFFTTISFAASSQSAPANLYCFKDSNNLYHLKWDNVPNNSMKIYKNDVYSNSFTGDIFTLTTFYMQSTVKLSYVYDLQGAINESALSSSLNVPSDCIGYVSTPTSAPTLIPTGTPIATPTHMPTPTPSGVKTPTPVPSGQPQPTDSDQSPPAPSATPRPIIVDDLNNCVSTLCSCIQQLTPVLDQINQATNGVISAISNQLLPQLQDINSKLADQLQLSQDIKNALIEFKNEFQNPSAYPINAINDYPSIQLTDNKPPMRETVYSDNTTYFTDQGDDTVPAPFPVAPEPTNNWKDSEGHIVTKQDPIHPQPVQSKAPAMQKDTVLERDQPLVRQTPTIRSEPLTKAEYEALLRWRSSDYHQKEVQK